MVAGEEGPERQRPHDDTLAVGHLDNDRGCIFGEVERHLGAVAAVEIDNIALQEAVGAPGGVNVRIR